MVIKHVTEETSTQIQAGPAPYLDRFFANIINFLILAPVVSLFCSGITNDLRWTLYSKESGDIYSLIFQYVFVTFALFILYEAMFIYFHGATPGHRFLYMRVVDQNGRRPSLLCALFRSAFKFQAILFAGVPFIEVTLRADRTAFYDRLAQTRLISLRSYKHDEIHPELRNVIHRWVNTSIIFFFLGVGLVFYKTVSAPSNYKIIGAKSKCTESLDFYLKNYLSKSRESENLNCSRELVEKSFDTNRGNSDLNYLAQFIVTANADLKDSYRNKYCTTQAHRLICQKNDLVDFSKIKITDSEDVINLLVDLNQSLVKNNHARVFTILDVLYTHLDWNKNLELYYLTSYLFLNEQSSRSPASENSLAKSEWEARKTRFLKRMSVKL